MRTLIVGAGATGGYLADLLTAGGRDVTVLVRDGTRDAAVVAIQLHNSRLA